MIMKYTSQDKPKKCPKCGSRKVVRIIYGLPTEEAYKEHLAGKIALGGCIISGNDPAWQCLDCGTDVFRSDIIFPPSDPEANFGIPTLFETNDRVFANWFTGVIEIPSGEVIAHTRYGEELYSLREIYFQ